MSEVLSNAQSMAREGKYSQIGSDLMSGLSESLNTAKTRSSNNLQTSIDKQYEALAVAHEKAEKAKQDQIDKAKGKKNKKKRKKLKTKILQKFLFGPFYILYCSTETAENQGL